MSDLPLSIMSHVSIGTSSYEKALAFYDKVLSTIGAVRILEHHEFHATAYGRQFPEFWVQAPHDGKPPSVGNGSHFAFLAPDRKSVDAFFKAALEEGGQPDGEPGPRIHYGAGYYGCFVKDLDGHKIEAMFWDETA